MKTKNLFSIAIKWIAIVWQTNKSLLFILILLNIFQGAVAPGTDVAE